MEIKKIAVIENGYTEKFGVPRQSGLVNTVLSKIIFEKEYRVKEAVRGLEDFSHLWLIWDFSLAHKTDWSPTVRPPRLGGNQRVGVFATRSPYRPNPLGLTVVKLEKVEIDRELGPVLYVSGADLMNGTPIFDIKPYIPYADAIPSAVGGFTDTKEKKRLKVSFCDSLSISEELSATLSDILKEDPRPAYQNDRDRIYKMIFDRYEISFSVDEDTLFVSEVKEIK